MTPMVTITMSRLTGSPSKPGRFSLKANSITNANKLAIEARATVRKMGSKSMTATKTVKPPTRCILRQLATLTEEARADQIAFATSVLVPHMIRLALGSIELTPLRTALEKVRYIVEMYSCL